MCALGRFLMVAAAGVLAHLKACFVRALGAACRSNASLSLSLLPFGATWSIWGSIVTSGRPPTPSDVGRWGQLLYIKVLAESSWRGQE